MISKKKSLSEKDTQEILDLINEGNSLLDDDKDFGAFFEKSTSFEDLPSIQLRNNPNNPFGNIEKKLSQKGPNDIRFDFMDGCRIWLPEPAHWHVRLRDTHTNTVIFDDALFSSGLLQTEKRYFFPLELTIWKNQEEIFSHVFSLENKKILVSMHLGALGDHIAWIEHVSAFSKIHNCRIDCCVSPALIPLFEKEYPHITFITNKELQKENDYYAHYKVMIFANDLERKYQPNDYRQSGLVHTAPYILGLPPIERKPHITLENNDRPLEEPYICIATQASGLYKYWLNPHGWPNIIQFLQKQGYRIVCIDQSKGKGQENIWNMLPKDVIDETGDKPLTERARWLKHADFFIGLSSGLSWLAWTVNTPVVMISGFTEPFNEFFTPYRVINRHVCTGCANDTSQLLDRNDPLFCPYFKGTDRMFECSYMITPEHVISTLRPLLKK
ncbi:autotransporter strand-loop-strand O-heptosyltransferase [Swingsia samuiensis]|uniref:Autotransporter strand-loop-strand O-heptosyltransferase n=2 Tax=Swingsia samuiensis TaxID=1293412 RepID=A0A4Y6ULV0_9PROT|nr:autotransporter strand-loop-strand O-heptosyltransferase [Swingsia samuiensis]